jgi:hypothetical protein
MPLLSVDCMRVLNERLGRHCEARRVVPLPLAALLEFVEKVLTVVVPVCADLAPPLRRRRACLT